MALSNQEKLRYSRHLNLPDFGIPTQEKLKKAIKSASSKNYKALQKWRDNNPDFMQNDDKKDYFVYSYRAYCWENQKL